MADNDHNTRVPRPAHNYVPEYQQSGIPFIFTFEVDEVQADRVLTDGNNGNIDDFKIEFDFVTRWLTLHCHDTAKSTCRLYFSRAAALKAYSTDVDGNPDPDMHFHRIDGEETTQRLEIKSKFIYLIPEDRRKAMSVSVIAGLTNIRSKDFPDQTSANGFTGIED